GTGISHYLIKLNLLPLTRAGSSAPFLDPVLPVSAFATPEKLPRTSHLPRLPPRERPGAIGPPSRRSSTRLSLVYSCRRPGDISPSQFASPRSGPRRRTISVCRDAQGSARWGVVAGAAAYLPCR